jgi:hypothetical protein
MVLVTFPSCPPPNDAAVEKEAALEAFLKNRVTELVNENCGGIELPHILQTLSEESIPDLPPGGGLSAKYVSFKSYKRDTFHSTRYNSLILNYFKLAIGGRLLRACTKLFVQVTVTL